MEKRSSILIVEDDVQWGRIVSNMLKPLPNIVYKLTHTTEDALKAINTEKFDLAICDLYLAERHHGSPEDLTGLNLISYLNKNSPNTKIVVITAYAQDHIKDLFRFGVSDIVGKQEFNKIDFIKLIEKELKKSRKSKSFYTNELQNIEEIPEDAIDLLENLLQGFLHSLGKHIGISRFTTREIYESLSQSGSEIQPEVFENLKILSSSIENIKLLTERLRNIAGRQPTLFKPVDLNKLIEEVISQSEYVDSEKLLLELDYKLPKIEGDRESLWQLFENLTSNAFEALDLSGGKVFIKTFVDDISSNIQITVTDTGRGIANENIPHIFKINYSTKPRGLGIGLYLVKKCVNFHGGSIICKSKIGKGTSFQVSLPFRRTIK